MNNVCIIGASHGIGAAIAAALGDSALLWTLSREPDHGVHHAIWDAATQEFPEGFLPASLDGLVYCPGTISLKPFSRLDDDSFRRDLDTNLMGAVRAIRAALPALKAAPQASILLFSTVAVGTGMPMHSSIAAAKGAVEGLARSLAAELAPQIRVNVIAPSLTDTPLASGLLRTDRQREAAAKRHPLDRVGNVDDIAAAARFLLSDESSWVTGQVINVDGGLGALRRFD